MGISNGCSAKQREEFYWKVYELVKSKIENEGIAAANPITIAKDMGRNPKEIREKIGSIKAIKEKIFVTAVLHGDEKIKAKIALCPEYKYILKAKY